jgi:hypothetical protein
MLNCLKKLKIKSWTYLVKDRKSWYELVQKNKPARGCIVRSERITTLEGCHSGVDVCCVRQSPDFYPACTLRKSGDISLLPLYAFIGRREKILPLTFKWPLL